MSAVVAFARYPDTQVGDYLQPLEAVIYPPKPDDPDEAWLPYDLTDATDPWIRVVPSTGGAALIPSGGGAGTKATAVIANATGGVLQYVLNAAAVAAAGFFRVQWGFTKGGRDYVSRVYEWRIRENI